MANLKFDTFELVGAFPYADNGEQVLDLPDLPVQGLWLQWEGTYNAGTTPSGTVLNHAASRLFSDIIVELNGRQPIHISGDELANLQSTIFGVAAQETNPANAGSGETVNAMLYLPLANYGDVVPLDKVDSKSLRIRFGNGVAALVSGAASDASLSVSKVQVLAHVRHLPPAAQAQFVAPLIYLYSFRRSLNSSMNHESLDFGDFKAVKAVHLMYRESDDLTAFSGNLTRMSVREAGRPLTAELEDYFVRSVTQLMFNGAVHASHAPIVFSAFGKAKQLQNTHSVDISGGSLVLDTAAGLTSPTLSVVVEGVIPISDAIGAFYSPNRVPAPAFSSITPGAVNDVVPSFTLPPSIPITGVVGAEAAKPLRIRRVRGI